MDPQEALQEVLAARAEGVRHRLVATWDDVPQLSHAIDAGDHDAPASSGDLFPWTAVCFVARGDQVLAVRDASHPLDWEPPGGRGEPPESPAETARREVREETGLVCEVTRLLATDTLRFDYGEGPTVPVEQAVFAAEFVDGSLDTEPGIDAAWHPVDDLPRSLQYRETLGGALDGP